MGRMKVSTPVLRARRPVLSAAAASGIFLRVHCRGADVVMHLRDEVLQRIGRPVEYPGDGDDEGTQDGVGLLVVQFGERLAVLLLSARVEGVEAVAVELLAIGGRCSDEEVDELRCSRSERPRHSLAPRHEQRAEAAKRGELHRSEESRRSLGVGIRGGIGELRGD